TPMAYAHDLLPTRKGEEPFFGDSATAALIPPAKLSFTGVIFHCAKRLIGKMNRTANTNIMRDMITSFHWRMWEIFPMISQYEIDSVLLLGFDL
ncbi:MAG: hypothetical protein OXK74_04880, partial [Gemmatimonadota bacterium]|nr:hypothetical protein [Gemmatimonadota bacterium]